MSPAFKEWHAVVEALVAGDQVLVLRKGGIAEGRGGFTPDRASRFWLFPTRFHAQAEKLKPSASRFLSPMTPGAIETHVTLRAFADVTYHAFLSDWKEVERLDRFHFLTSDLVRERFDWAKPPGLHALILRVHRIDKPVTLPLTPEMSGCKSWIELPLAFNEHPSSPVLGEPAFNARSAAIGLA